MPNLPNEISDFMETHGVLADEIWAVRPGVYAVKHKALERVAVARGVNFNADRPAFPVTDLPGKHVMCVVWGKMGDRVEWSVGEAAPYNNKNGYPAAMAEKRAKDRVILKLLNAHGALYSESEADEFSDPDQGEKGTVNKSTGLARDIYKQVADAIERSTSLDHLQEVSKAYKEQIRATNPQWRQELTRLYDAKADELRAKEAA